MTKNKGGRPTKYSQNVAAALCASLAEGESLRTACSPKEMPCVKTVFNWMHSNEEFLQQYTRAKQESADALTDEMLDIADDATNDWMERQGKDAEGYEVNGEHIQRSRLRIETRKWLSSKLKPKKYGDKIVTEHSGSVGFIDLTNDELEAKKRELEQALKQSTQD